MNSISVYAHYCCTNFWRILNIYSFFLARNNCSSTKCCYAKRKNKSFHGSLVLKIILISEVNNVAIGRRETSTCRTGCSVLLTNSQDPLLESYH